MPKEALEDTFLTPVKFSQEIERLVKNSNGKITSEGIFVNKELNASNTDGINTTNMRGLVTNNASININNGVFTNKGANDNNSTITINSEYINDSLLTNFGTIINNFIMEIIFTSQKK